MKKYIWIIPILAILGIGIALFWIIPAEETVMDQIHQIEVEELKRENSTLVETNALLDDKVALLKQMTDSLQALIIVDRQRVKTLKEGRDERINAISNFTDDELYRYFARFSTKDTIHRE